MKKIRYQEHHNTELDKQIRRVHHNVQKALNLLGFENIDTVIAFSKCLRQCISQAPKGIEHRIALAYRNMMVLQKGSIYCSQYPVVWRFGRNRRQRRRYQNVSQHFELSHQTIH